MQQEANKSLEFISGPLAPSATLRDIFNKLGPRNRSVKQVIANLAARGSHYSKSAVYNVIYGRTVNPGIASEFLDVAEEELKKRKELTARTQSLADPTATPAAA